MIEIGLSRGNDFFGVLKPPRINIRESGHFGVGTGQRFAHQLHAAVAGADKAHTNPIIGSQNTGTG